MSELLIFLGIKKRGVDRFSDFINNSSSRDKKKIFLKVAREANAEQREMVELAKKR